MHFLLTDQASHFIPVESLFPGPLLGARAIFLTLVAVVGIGGGNLNHVNIFFFNFNNFLRVLENIRIVL